MRSQDRLVIQPIDAGHAASRSGLISARATTANAAVLTALIIAALYLGKIVFLPFAAAVLVAFILSPIVKALRTVRIPRAIAVFAVVIATFAGLGAVAANLTEQARELASELPRFETTLRKKARDMRGVAISSPALERATETLKELKEELEGDSSSGGSVTPVGQSNPVVSDKDHRKLERSVDRIAPGTASANRDHYLATTPDAEGSPKPIPVEIHYPQPKPLANLIAWLAPVVEPLAMLAIVIILVLFILLQKEDLRDRFIRLSGANDMQRTTAAMTDAGQRLSRFLLTLTVLNVTYGAFIAAAMWWLGVPAPLLWGILAGLMRFVPFVGSFIAAALPVILAASIDPGWNTFFLTLGLFIVGEALMGQVIEPLAQGRTTGLSPLAILVSTAFWTLLWGPVGLLLAVPITLCLVVLGQHVDGLKFLHVLLGDEPAFSPGERFYQRTLAGDANEITEMAERQLAEAPLSVYYRDVALEGLRLAQCDADRGMIEDEHMQRISETVETMVDNLWETADRVPMRDIPDATADSAKTGDKGITDDLGTAAIPVLSPDDLAPGWQVEGAVLCVPAKSRIDEAAAHVLSHLIYRHGIDAVVAPNSASVFQDHSEKAAKARMICICSMSENLADSRYLARRIARRFPNARILAIVWGAKRETCVAFTQSQSNAGADVTNSLATALADIVAEGATAELADGIRAAMTNDVACIKRAVVEAA